MTSADDLIQHVNSKVSVTDKLLGGIAFVDRLAKDTNGKLFNSLEKYDANAEGLDDNILRQPRVDVS